MDSSALHNTRTSKKYKVYYFTASFPYGLGETWKSNELNILKNYFDDITVIPYGYDGNINHPKLLPSGIKGIAPLFETQEVNIGITSLLKLIDSNFFYYFIEFFKEFVFINKKKLSSWLLASLKIKQLLQKPFIADLIRNPDPDLILCFFWGKGSCDFLPFINKNKFKNIVVRFHRYDLIEEENDGYIPYRKHLLRSLCIAAPSSQNGVNYLKHKYPQLKEAIKLVRLGVRDCGIVNMSSDKVLRVLSCSYVIPVKRVALIAASLAKLDFEVEWTHIGDGPLMNEVHAIIRTFPPNIKVNLPGMVDADELINYYKTRNIDIFINVSTSEGVPMSILECLSLSIPVFATAVGGSGEAVDDSVGRILPADLKPALLAEKISEFYYLSASEKISLRTAARKRFEDMGNVEKLSTEFAELISGGQLT